MDYLMNNESNHIISCTVYVGFVTFQTNTLSIIDGDTTSCTSQNVIIILYSYVGYETTKRVD